MGWGQEAWRRLDRNVPQLSCVHEQLEAKPQCLPLHATVMKAVSESLQELLPNRFWGEVAVGCLTGLTGPQHEFASRKLY